MGTVEQTAADTHKVKNPEVVLSISNSALIEEIQPISISTTPEENLTRRRTTSTLTRSSNSKPNSRLLEPTFDTHSINDNKGDLIKNVPISSKPEEEEDDDEDVYKTANIKVSERSRKKLKATVLIEWTLFICIMGILVSSLTIHKLKSCMLWALEIWKWCVLVLVFFCGGLFTEWFINLIVFLLERNFLLKRKVLYFVFALKKSVRVSIWLSLILIAWTLLINRGVKRPKNTTRILNYITRALVSCLIGAGLWMVKTFLLKLLASSFHVSRFFDRIQESIFHQYVLQTLSGFPLVEYEDLELVGKSDSKRSNSNSNSNSNSSRLSFRKQTKKNQIEKEEVIDVEKLHKMKQDKISAWTMRGLIEVISGSRLTTLSSVLDRSIDGDDDDDHGQAAGAGAGQKEITSEVQAKAAAIRIFKNVAKPHSKHIEEEDLLRFMKKDDVDNVLHLFDGAIGNGKIPKSSWKAWVVNVYNERKSLAHSLKDTKTAIEELNKIVSALLLVVIMIVWLLLMGLLTTNVLVFISSQLLLVVFIFGNTCKMVFEAIIFVFVMHPFDIGDRCVIDGVQMVVEEMNILTTVFLRYDNEKIFYPNSILATKPISNFYRSPEMGDCVEFCIDVSTSVENILALKAKIKWYLESKPKYWRPEHNVQVKDIENINKMKMALYVTHTINFQNFAEKSNRRSELMFEIKKAFEELNIKYNLLPQQVYLQYSSPNSTIISH
ncbi:mechanosensitive ion channel protein 10-like [Impatiens glandulifera]|uniref:mechanosensitive ion channel protein 10-like n=1 Tax=Impatiens glandulifera TaxID=253017 RepID=UPI001FB08214|nr:mechanosensitive ion channel protein 10-like [Impatiens glandulifera]